jgi:hypothetical protein
VPRVIDGSAGWWTKNIKKVWAATLDLPVARNAASGAYGSVSVVSLVFLRSVKVSRGRESCGALKGLHGVTPDARPRIVQYRLSWKHKSIVTQPPFPPENATYRFRVNIPSIPHERHIVPAHGEKVHAQRARNLPDGFGDCLRGNTIIC